MTDTPPLTTAQIAAIRTLRAGIIGNRWFWDSYSAIFGIVPKGHPWDDDDADNGIATIAYRGWSHFANAHIRWMVESLGSERAAQWREWLNEEEV